MEFVAAREFRINPGKVWQKLKKIHKLIVTSNGKPIALLRDIGGLDLEDELRAEAMKECAMAVSKMRDHSRKHGLDKLTHQDIDKEIAAARKQP